MKPHIKVIQRNGVDIFVTSKACISKPKIRVSTSASMFCFQMNLCNWFTNLRPEAIKLDASIIKYSPILKKYDLNKPKNNWR